MNLSAYLGLDMHTNKAQIYKHTHTQASTHAYALAHTEYICGAKENERKGELAPFPSYESPKPTIHPWITTF